MNIPEQDIDNNVCVRASNVLLEKFVLYCWSEYRFQPADDQKRLLKWLLTTDTSIKGTRAERTLKLKLESALSFLTKSRDDPMYADENGQTILHILLLYYVHNKKDYPSHNDFLDQQYADCQITKDLINAGASIIAADHNGITPISIAISKNRLDVLRSIPKIIKNNDAFYTQNAFINTYNIRNNLGETVLHIIMKSYVKGTSDSTVYEEIIKKIVSKNADLNISDINGMTPVHYAAMRCYLSTLQLFKDRNTIMKVQTKNGDNLLILACKNITMVDNDLMAWTTINWLLDQGMDVNHRNRGGHTALHYAAQSGQMSIIKKLIERKANVKVLGLDGAAPLHAAVMSSSGNVVEYLIEHSVDMILRESEFGFSMIHLAALNSDNTVFKQFINGGSRIDRPSKNGFTPMHLAAMSANTKVVEELIKRGADVHCRDETWLYTPLHLASMRGQFRSLDEMDVLGCEDQLDMNQLNLIRHCFRRLKFKINVGIDYKPVIDLLLKAGATLEAKDTHGWASLHCAVQQSEADVVELLLKEGACVDAMDNDGYVPLQYALLATADNWPIIQCLLKYGANIQDVESIIKDIYDKSKISKFTIADRLLRHVAKLECAGLLFGSFYKPESKMARLEQFQPAYQKEIQRMKGRMLTDNVSLFDMLHMTSRQRASFIDKLPRDIEVGLSYQNYGVVFYGRCYEAINRESMLDNAKLACNLLTQVQWPELCIEYIFSFLRNRDLKALIDSMPEIELENLLNNFSTTLIN